MRNPHFLSYITATIALALPGCSRTESTSAPTAPPVATVQIVRVKQGNATRSITLPANVLAYEEATLYAKVAGYVKSVAVDKGDAIQQGASLAEIEVPELQADRGRYLAEVQVADIDYKRVSDAQRKAPDLVVPQTVDNAKGTLDIAKAKLERTETLLGFSKIVAPFSGVITRRMIDPGAFVPAATSGSPAQNAAMFTIMNFTKVRVQAAVPEPEVPFIRDGLPAQVKVEELRGVVFDGTVTRYSHALDNATRTMLTEIELPNLKGDLRPGMFASVRITMESKPGAMLIPADALVVEKTRSSVFIVADGKAKRMTVKTGFVDAGSAEIVEGLKLDDTVILVGKQSLADGQPVKVQGAQ